MNDADRELIGRTLGGRFRLTGYIGAGAMASVFRGEQDGDPRDVAVKVMHPELLRDATFAKRFAREARTAARIAHRNTVRIVDHGTDGDLLYLAMELCAGEDLFDVLAREKRLGEARAARIAIQICSALSAAHADGVVHRDLKPENVMICEDPDDGAADLVKVLDFGIAKSFERDRPHRDEPPESGGPMSAPPSSALTMVGALVGTPEYMSPEQCLGMPVDARSDVYAVGALLFQLVTGRTPFTGKAPIDVLMAQTDMPPPAPSSLVPGLHAGIERVVLRALAKLPENRFQSAREMSDALAALLPELEAGPRPAKIASVPPPRSSAVHGGAASGPTPRAPSEPSLPGVPVSVSITEEDGAPISSVPAERPPDTLRSTALAAEDRAGPAAPAEAPPPPPQVQVFPAHVPARVSKAEALAATLAEGAVLPKETSAKAAEAMKMALAKTVRDTPPPPPDEPLAPPTADRPALGEAGEPSLAPWLWAAVTTILVVILVLVRYLRFR